MEKEIWDKILKNYFTIKKLYIDCEETDPSLNTNLQPLNEFRAALDHLMRIMAIEHWEEYQDIDEEKQADKLLSHLKRAFYDVCDSLTINYRNKIIDFLQVYSTDVIRAALPDYYPTIRPKIETLTKKIEELRDEKGFCNIPADVRMNEYVEVVNEFRKYYEDVLKASPSLEDLHKKEQVRLADEKNEKKREKRRIALTQYLIPIGAIVVGVIVAVIGWVVGK